MIATCKCRPIANGVCQNFKLEDVMCLSKIRNDLFSTANGDNIDHNPSSAQRNSFHGTGISLMQNPTHYCVGFDSDMIVINHSTSIQQVD